jgi:polyphosphate kinase 2 (PPK2 family)
MLSENRVRVVKFLLCISKDEQAKRFRDQYIEAYNDALRKCAAPQAPWYVIPANKKWFRNMAVSDILIHTLESMKMKFPKAPAHLSHLQFE